MRFREIKHLIMQEARLDELKMSPSALDAFAKSDAASGIQAGFEAELIFRDAADTGGGDTEPDFDQDTTIDSIDEMREFFSGDNSYRQIDELVSAIENDGWLDYFFEKQAEYVQENMDERMDYKFDEWFDDEVEDLVRTALEEAKEYNAKEIDSILKAGLSSYRENEWDSRETYDQMDSIFQEYKIEVAEKAREEFNEEHEDEVREELEEEFNQGEDVDFGDFLRDRFGNRYASTIWEEYSSIVDWPYYNETYEEGGFNEYAAENIASELKQLLGMEVTYSMGYHSARRRAGVWIIEPDSSLEPDDYTDMGAEIVSPPMPLQQCLEKMETLFTWAQSDGNAYANRSTGFHMGVSLPITGGRVDFVKLALFLGDEHVLEQFGRSSNSYAEAAVKKIRSRIKSGGSRVDEAMTLMHNGLIELANRAIMGAKNDGFGKYTSINPKGAYIEFRSAGGEDYIEDFKKAKNTLLRYAQAMAVAANPAAERQEYYKKLYKLISPPQGNAALDLFARYSSGNISAEELKKQWANAALEKTGTTSDKRVTWKVYDAEKQKYLPNYQYSGYTESEALALFKQAYSPGSSMEDFEKYMQHMKYEMRDVSTNTGRWEIINRATGETLEVIDAANNRDAGDLAQQMYSGKGIDYYIQPHNPRDTSTALPVKTDRRVELAKRIKQSKEKPTSDTSGQPDRPIYNWVIYQDNDQVVHKFYADGMNEALRVLDQWKETHNGNFTIGQPRQPAVAGSTQDIQQQRVQPGQFTGAWAVLNANTGEEVYRFSGVGNHQGDANRVAANWVRSAHYDDPVEVIPIVG